MSSTRRTSVSEVVYALLLWCYPPAFREAVGADLRETFRDAHRAAVRRSRWYLVPFWLSTVLDFVRSAFAEWAQPNKHKRYFESLRARKAPMEALFRDVRYSVRRLARSPAFTVTVVVTLMLGIGANAAIFSLINEVLLRPLPVHDPDRLVRLYTSDYSSGLFGGSSFPDYMDFRGNSEALEDLAAFSFPGPVNFGTDDVAARLTAQMVSGNYFELLGLSAAHGRMLGPSDAISVGGHPVTVISHATWQSRFAGDPDVLGEAVSLNGSPFTIVGVAPEGFGSLEVGVVPDVWVPLVMYGQIFPTFARFPVLDSRSGRWLRVVGRLNAGATLSQAAAEMTGIMANLAAEYPNTNLGTLQAPDNPRPVTLVPAEAAFVGPRVRDATVGRARLLMAIVVSVLLIACANVANLMLARSSRTARQTALRLAIGASRSRIAREVLTESVLLGAIGGTAGLLLAVVLTKLLLPLGLSSALQATVSVESVSLDYRVVSFTLLASVVTGVLFGALPAMQGTRPNLTTTLTDGHAHPITVRRRRYGIRDALVVVQLAASLVLLVAAGLFVQSTIAAYRTDLGFRVAGVALASVDPANQGLEPTEGETFFRSMLDEVGEMPGVEHVALAMTVPVDATGPRTTVAPEGYSAAAGEDMELNFNVVSDGYFETLEIQIVRGRSFAPSDRADAAPVVIVNQEFANRFWPGEQPLGKRVSGGSGGQTSFEVVGVARDGKYRSIREDPIPYVYFPLWQFYQGTMTLIARAPEPTTLLAPIRSWVRAQQPGMPVFDGQLLKDHFAEAIAQERSTAVMIGVLGLLALTIASVGVYGVVSYAVAQRLQEFGIRTALGARAGDLIRLVLGRGARLAVAGVAIGSVAALGFSSFVARFVFGVSPTDPATLIAVAMVMIAMVLTASLLPALRATRYDPVSALRSD